MIILTGILAPAKHLPPEGIEYDDWEVMAFEKSESLKTTSRCLSRTYLVAPFYALHCLDKNLIVPRMIPGNTDPHTNDIIHTNTFSLTSRGSSVPLDPKTLCGIVAHDDRRRRYRFTLGEIPSGSTPPWSLRNGVTKSASNVFDGFRWYSGIP